MKHDKGIRGKGGYAPVLFRSEMRPWLSSCLYTSRRPRETCGLCQWESDAGVHRDQERRKVKLEASNVVSAHFCFGYDRPECKNARCDRSLP